MFICIPPSPLDSSAKQLLWKKPKEQSCNGYSLIFFPDPRRNSSFFFFPPGFFSELRLAGLKYIFHILLLSYCTRKLNWSSSRSSLRKNFRTQNNWHLLWRLLTKNLLKASNKKCVIPLLTPWYIVKKSFPFLFLSYIFLSLVILESLPT